jgi:hypothetical protein
MPRVARQCGGCCAGRVSVRGIALRRLSVLTVAATVTVGLASVGVAQAAPSMTATPSTGLSEGTSIHVEVFGLNTVGLPNVKIAECANAAGDGTALATVVPATDCQIFADAAPSPLGSLAVDFAVKQSGIGIGNRSCLASLATPCEIKIVESTNQPTIPSPVPLSFIGDPAPNTGATTTELTPVGSPVGIDKTPHARVEVTTTPGFIAQGSVTVFEGVTPVGTGVLADGAADIALDPLPLGAHSLVAQFTGDGSFAPSTSSAQTMEITKADNISIGDTSVMEGPAGRYTSIAFPVVLSHASPTPLTVDVDIASGTGPDGAQVGSIVGGVLTPGTDVLQRHATLKFAANRTVVMVFVAKVVGDNEAEANQTFSVVLSSPSSGFALRRPTGTGTILDDDTSPPSGPRVDIGDASVTEGDTGGSRVLRFSVTMSSAVAAPVAITLRIWPVTGMNGRRSTGADWGGPTSKTIRLAPNQLSKYLSVPAYPDTRSELDETFTVDVTTVTGFVPAPGGRTSAVGTILSDE